MTTTFQAVVPGERMRSYHDEFGGIVENLPDGILLVDDDKKSIVYANPKMSDILGYQATEFAALSIGDLVSPSFFETFLNSLETGTIGDAIYHQDAGLIRKDGTPICCDAKIFHLETRAKPVIAILFLDISARRETEGALQAKIDELDRYFESSLDLLCIADTKGYFRRVNQEWERTLGYTPEELMGRQFLELVHPDDVNSTIDAVSKLSAQKEIHNFVNRYRHKDGAWRWIEWRSFPQGEMIYAVARDITERYLAEETLKESERLLQQSQRVALLGHYLFDVAAGTWSCSKMLDEIFGISDDFDKSIEGWLLVVHPEEREAMRTYLVNHVMGEGNPFERQYRILRQNDGETRWVHGIGSLELDENGLPIKLFGTIQDITEQKRNEMYLLNAQRLESIGLLAAGVAHDFNNLLYGMFGNVELAMDEIEYGRPEKGAERLKRTLDVFERARELTYRLLTFSKGGAPEIHPGNIGETVRNAIKTTLGGSELNIEVDIDDNLWECGYDSHQIEQSLSNMLTNAAQAMSADGHLKIEVDNTTFADKDTSTSLEGDYIRISIEDNGVGIPAGHLSKIYDPFFSTKKTSDGLGLSTSWSIVKRHGGCIDVHSTEGIGTTFSIYLPAKRRNNSALSSDGDTQIPAYDRILVMDDESTVREVVELMLIALGYQVTSTADGADALDRYRAALHEEHPFDAVLLDLTVPGGMGGQETLKQMRAIDPQVRAVALSGYADDPVISNPAEFGFTASLRKPFRKKNIETLFSDILSP